MENNQNENSVQSHGLVDLLHSPSLHAQTTQDHFTGSSKLESALSKLDAIQRFVNAEHDVIRQAVDKLLLKNINDATITTSVQDIMSDHERKVVNVKIESTIRTPDLELYAPARQKSRYSAYDVLEKLTKLDCVDRLLGFVSTASPADDMSLPIRHIMPLSTTATDVIMTLIITSVAKHFKVLSIRSNSHTVIVSPNDSDWTALKIDYSYAIDFVISDYKVNESSVEKDFVENLDNVIAKIHETDSSSSELESSCPLCSSVTTATASDSMENSLKADCADIRFFKHEDDDDDDSEDDTESDDEKNDDCSFYTYNRTELLVVRFHGDLLAVLPCTKSKTDTGLEYITEKCPFCGENHHHDARDGERVMHCLKKNIKHDYLGVAKYRYYVMSKDRYDKVLKKAGLIEIC